MIDVHGIQPPVAPEPTEPVGAARAGSGASQPAAAGDVVEISTAARLAAKIHGLPEVRQELVERVRAEIEAGSYETPARIEETVNRLMEDLLGSF